MMGIQEANMVGAAGGMARAGDIPFCHSFCVFITRRVYDQIAMQVAYPKLPVKLVGFLPGLATELGVSHQAIDDVALTSIVEDAMPAQARKHRDRDVIGNAHLGNDAFGLAIFGAEANPGGDGVCGAAWLVGGTSQRHFARIRRVDAEHESRRLGSARAK